MAAFAELFVPTMIGIVSDALGSLEIAMVPVAILQRSAISAASPRDNRNPSSSYAPPEKASSARVVKKG
jgi:hypothetical protein